MEAVKWKGTADAFIPGASVSEVWAVAGDFCGAQKWLRLDECSRIEGEENVRGCVRFCRGALGWAKERLVAFDPAAHSLAYEITDTNMGLSGYSASLKVIPAAEAGCRVEWSFELNPLQGGTKDSFLSVMHSLLDSLANVVLLNQGKAS